MSEYVTHVRLDYTCLRCGSRRSFVRPEDQRGERAFCAGTYEVPHGRRPMSVVVYDLVPVRRAAE